MNGRKAEFLEYLRSRGYPRSTIRVYLYTLGQFERFVADAALERLMAGDIERFVADLWRKGMKAATVSNKVATLKSFFRWARKRGYMINDPAGMISSIKIPRRLPRYLTVEQMARLLEAPDRMDVLEPLRSRDTAMLCLLYASGIRVGELLGLTIDSVGEIGDGVLRVFGKRSKERIVPVIREAAEAIRNYLRFRWAKSGVNSLWVTKNGFRLRYHALRVRMIEYGRWIGAAFRVTPHIMRHSFATHVLNKGCSLRVLMEVLGHSNLATTQIYTHVSIERSIRAIESSHPMALLNQSS